MAGRLKILRANTGSAIAAVMMVSLLPNVASAQIDARFAAIEGQLEDVDRLEEQVRALQRVVFPGGDGRFFEPEITPENASPVQVNTPSASALTDVLTRLDAIEGQLARLTAATEVNENALSLLELRMAAVEQAASSSQASTGVLEVQEAAQEVGPPAELAALVEEAVGPTPARLEGVQAIAKPATDDAADDEYVYGFRLWDAGFYPEAQQQLALFVEQYPDHWRTTYGRNLLGRAYLDAGEPRRAATHFFDNYQTDMDAARAPDSLLYLSESMIELGDTGRACIALSEFGEIYPALATGRLQGQYESNLGRVDCE